VGQSTTVQVAGAVTVAPSSPAQLSTSVQAFLKLDLSVVYESAKGGIVSVNSTSLSPFVVPFEGIVRGRFFAFRLESGATMEVHVVTGLGTAIFPVSDELVIHNPNPGDEFTAISLIGAGDVRYLLAGDLS
jgi:hypothetical protein